ncbi:MAG: ATP-binding protein [Patescibacteria group bacterium]|nr:ATP-binding protein [Patescibacteria group bacterium]
MRLKALPLSISLSLVALLATTAASVLIVYRLNRLADEQLTANNTSDVAAIINGEAQHLLLFAQSLAGLQAASQEVTHDGFTTFSELALTGLDRQVTLEWVDANDTVRFVFPENDANLKTVGTSVKINTERITALKAAKLRHISTSTPPHMLRQGYPGFVLFHPVYKGNDYLGSAVVVVGLESFLSRAAETLYAKGLDGDVVANNITVPMGGTDIFTADGRHIINPVGDSEITTNPPTVPTSSIQSSKQISVADQVWIIRVFNTGQPIYLKQTVVYAFFALFVVAILGALMIALERRRRLLQAAYERERSTVSLISHQLRAPITEMAWIVEAFFDEHRLPQEMKEPVMDMHIIVRNAAKLIDDILNMSRIERGVLKISAAKIPLSDIVEDALKPLRSVAADKKIKFIVNVPTDIGVWVDRLKAAEALRNIVDNAIRYGPDGSDVEIYSQPGRPGIVELAVSDSGSGIPREARATIFDIKTENINQGGETHGAGLGLYLAKQFVKLMGGDIRFETSPNGTTFFISLLTDEPIEGKGK